METNKIQGEAKSLVLNNGIELTYCERGEQNKDILLTGAFYFHTAMPLVEMLAKRYHVYGFGIGVEGNPSDSRYLGSGTIS